MSEKEEDQKDIEDEPAEVTQSSPPSHILQDGRFIFLPEPSDTERSKFLERSIARHKLLNDDMKGDDDAVAAAAEDKDAKDSKEEGKKDSTQPKVHPLALASARLQANGVSELSKAVNLTGLVSAGEYFGLSNIVNPSLEAVGVKKAADGKEEEEALDVAGNDLALRALYLGKRKRAQFEWATEALTRHERRLAGAVTTQQIVDRRLLRLRPQWRLVAPEHGTRARAHATRPTEVVAIDVDVYDRDRTGGGNQAARAAAMMQQTVGRLARRVPRYATVELPKEYKVKEDVLEWKKVHDMEDARGNGDVDGDGNNARCKTRAEPFAVADPTLGKIDVDFDPEKVPMLSLQLDIERDSTGFRQCAQLSPLTTLEENAIEDEKVVVALQHSLFCASLFESIRRELIPQDNEENGSTMNKATHHTDVWLSSAMEENFLPPVSLMAAGAEGGRGSLSVVHCHEGEVKVQLDCEYALTVKLVEAGTAVGSTIDMELGQEEAATNGNTKSSGSQTPAQLNALCRALLLHAQDVYHNHSIEIRKFVAQKTKEDKEVKPMGLATKKKKDELPQAHILQDCVSLGVKMIFERKVRWALGRVKKWLLSQSASPDAKITVDWLPLSIFDKQTQFVLSYNTFVIDVSIECDEMTVTRFGENGEYRKAVFHSEDEFEMFLKIELTKLVKADALLQQANTHNNTDI
jgi:hypothetical protein